MIYLLAQMLLYIALAGVAGAAVGWLLHRARAGGADEELRETIVRQHHQLRHAETDVAMLTEDFDDLKQRSQHEIESLRTEARRVPALLQNLDKSQTLVRQLMQKHEAQLRELTQHNDELRERVSAHEEREAALARARSELESARAELSRLRDASDVAADARSDAEADAPTAAGADSGADAVPDDPSDGVPEEVPDAGTRPGDVPERSIAHVPSGAPAANGAAPAPDLPPRGFGVRLNGADRTPERGVPATAVTTGLDAGARALEPAAPGAYFGPVPLDPAPNGGAGGFGTDDIAAASGDDEDDDRSDVENHSDDFDDDFDNDFEDGDDEGLFDESVELMFEPVDRHDDLQRIFGIGPVTERALNRLGITSYSQLAELESTDVERIADALQIYSGRIERDDWVGNARRQLEDVLEEL